MSLILSKLILPSVLILLPSLAARRWGDAIGGWLVGLPLTTGPVVAFLCCAASFFRYTGLPPAFS